MPESRRDQRSDRTVEDSIARRVRDRSLTLLLDLHRGEKEILIVVAEIRDRRYGLHRDLRDLALGISPKVTYAGSMFLSSKCVTKVSYCQCSSVPAMRGVDLKSIRSLPSFWVDLEVPYHGIGEGPGVARQRERGPDRRWFCALRP